MRLYGIWNIDIITGFYNRIPLPIALYLPFREILYILRHTLDKLLAETGLLLLRHKFMLHAHRNLTLPFPFPNILSHREE
jgi:hypothetical protein